MLQPLLTEYEVRFASRWISSPKPCRPGCTASSSALVRTKVANAHRLLVIAVTVCWHLGWAVSGGQLRLLVTRVVDGKDGRLTDGHIADRIELG